MTQDNPTVAESVINDPDQLRALAAQGRGNAAAAKAEAEAAFQTTQAEAARMVAEARQRVTDADTQVRTADHQATLLEERAANLDAAGSLRQQIADTEAAIVALKTEHDGLTDKVDALDEQLAGLGEQREDVAAALAKARDAGDVDQVLACRTRLAAIDEVTASLGSQRQAAQDRRTAINNSDQVGALIDAAGRWRDLTAELRRVENLLDPTRPEAKFDALADQLREGLAGYLADYAHDQTQPTTTTQTLGGSALVRRNN